MSDDYQSGYDGGVFPIGGDWNEYSRGQNDALVVRGNVAPGRVLNTDGVYKASIEVGKGWAQNPNASLNRMLLLLVGAAVVVGLIGFGLASFLGPTWTPSPTAWAIQFAAVGFWLAGAMVWGWIVAALFSSRRTLRALIVWLALTAVLGYMLWGFLSPIIGGFTS